MARHKKVLCILEGCDDEAIYQKAQMCGRCYSRVYYQLKRGVSWAVKRSRRIQSWQSGLEMVLGNIKPIEKRRRKRA